MKLMLPAYSMNAKRSSYFHQFQALERREEIEELGVKIIERPVLPL